MHDTREKIILYLANDESTEWILFNEENKLLASSHTNSAHTGVELTAIAMGKTVIVVVDAEDILLTTATLPPMQRSRLRPSLPYALEDKVIADVDTLHFSYLSQDADNKHKIAIVAREKMEFWLARLNALHIEPDVLLPITFCLPFDKNAWHILMTHRVVVRMDYCAGFAADISQFNVWLAAALAQTDSPPTQIHLHHYSEATFPAETIWPSNCVIEKFYYSRDKFLEQATKNCLAVPFNLLQGAYAVKSTQRLSLNKLGRITMSLGLVWVVLLLLIPTIQYFLLHHQLAIVDAQIAKIYRQQFPHAKQIIAPQSRLAEKLNHERSGVQDSQFILLLSQVAAAMQAVPGVNLKRLHFQGDQLTIELSATPTIFADFNHHLMQSGRQVKQQNANLLGTQLNVILVLT